MASAALGGLARGTDLPLWSEGEAQGVKKAHPLLALLPICSLESNSVLCCV